MILLEYIYLIDWLNDEIIYVFFILGDKNIWVLERFRRFYGRRLFDYAVLIKDGFVLVVVVEVGFVFDFDLLKFVREEELMEIVLN